MVARTKQDDEGQDKADTKSLSEARRERDGVHYRLGDVGSKGQSILGKMYNTGDDVWLLEGEAVRLQNGGVPLTRVDESDSPRAA